MSFVLMLVGILATALGAILIGFGIPINEFSLGNTLILAGTVTAAAGVIVFALSRVVGQLSRIADTLGDRPLTTGMVGATDAQNHSQSDLGRFATPPRASAPRAAPPRVPEPQLQPSEFELPPPVEPIRPVPNARGASLPMEEHQEVSLSPRAPARAAPVDMPSPSGWRPPRPSAEAAQRKPEPPRRPVAPQPAPEANRKPAAPVRREPALDPTPETAAPRPEPVTVLKSGVVDGMAYTLYTDGSIEAELAQGVVRFGSIEELRNHLEKSA